MNLSRRKNGANNYAPAIVFDLKLFEPNKKAYPEFDYAQLMQEKTGNTSLFRDPLEENEEHQKLKSLAKKFEEKYGPQKRDSKGKKIKFGAPEDHLDLGMGYDKTDSFIDDSEAYDELVPSTLTTKYGGFYVNSGKLEFKEMSSSDEDDSDIINSSSDSGDDNKQSTSKFVEKSAKKKKKIRIISDDDEENDKGEQDVGKDELRKNVKENGHIKTSTKSVNAVQKKLQKNLKASATNKKPQQNNSNSLAEKIRKKKLSRISDVVRTVVAQADTQKEDQPMMPISEGIIHNPKGFGDSANAPPVVSSSKGKVGVREELDEMDLIAYINNDDIGQDKLVLPNDPTDVLNKESTVTATKNEADKEKEAEPCTSKESVDGLPSPPVQRMIGRPPTNTAKVKPTELSAQLLSTMPELKDLITNFEQLVQKKDESGKAKLNKETDAILAGIEKLTTEDGMNVHQRSKIFQYLAEKANRSKGALRSRAQNYMNAPTKRPKECAETSGKQPDKFIPETPHLLDALMKELEKEVLIQKRMHSSGSPWQFKWNEQALCLIQLLAKDQYHQYLQLPSDYTRHNSLEVFVQRLFENNLLEHFDKGTMTIEELMRMSKVRELSSEHTRRQQAGADIRISKSEESSKTPAVPIIANNLTKITNAPSVRHQPQQKTNDLKAREIMEKIKTESSGLSGKVEVKPSSSSSVISGHRSTLESSLSATPKPNEIKSAKREQLKITLH